MASPQNTAPIASRRSHTRLAHGKTKEEPWFWLRDRDDSDVLDYLRAENSWTDQCTAHLEDLRNILFREIRSRVKESDQSVPIPKGSWEYRVRTGEGLQYPLHVRQRLGDPESEEVLFDENKAAEGADYFAVGDLTVSPDHRFLAYTTDTEGNEEYDLTVIDLDTREVIDSGIRQLSYGLVWANDCRTLFMVLTDAAQRPNRIIRHVVGDLSSEAAFRRGRAADQRFLPALSRGA